MTPSPAPDPLVGHVIADRYRILQPLGEGGMGRVYLAEHVRMGRLSALKVLRPALALSGEAVARFNREASNASRINHPNVASIYDFGETADGLLYLAMEYVDGETLTDTVNRDGALGLHRAAEITKQAAAALSAAHQLGIVHRDLKPDNIMLTRQPDGSEWVKLLDFGIAKTTGDEGRSQTVTTAGISVGTPEYMSPEQLSGEPLDARTDIYSLALVLFNLLTGMLPFPAPTSRETLIRRLTSPPLSLSDARPDAMWPPRLEATLNRALASDRDDRHATAAAFAHDVALACPRDSAATVPMVSAPRPVARPPVRRTTKRTPRRATRLVTLIAMCVFIAVVTLAVMRVTLTKRGTARRSVTHRGRVAPRDTLEPIRDALRRAASPNGKIRSRD